MASLCICAPLQCSISSCLQAGNKSTLEDQAREAEAKRNSSEFVQASMHAAASNHGLRADVNCSLQEFKEDLGVSGERQSKEDKQDVESRESDAIGIRRWGNLRSTAGPTLAAVPLARMPFQARALVASAGLQALVVAVLTSLDSTLNTVCFTQGKGRAEGCTGGSRTGQHLNNSHPSD